MVKTIHLLHNKSAQQSVGSAQQAPANHIARATQEVTERILGELAGRQSSTNNLLSLNTQKKIIEKSSAKHDLDKAALKVKQVLMRKQQ